MKKTLYSVLLAITLISSLNACKKDVPVDNTVPTEQRTNMFGYANPSDDVTVKEISLAGSEQEFQLFRSDVFANGGVDMLGTSANDWATNEYTFSINSKNITVTQSYSEKVGIYTYSFMYDNINYCLVSRTEIPANKLGESFGEVFVEIGAM